MAKKKICFYSFLSSGHMNISVTLAKSLLNNFPNIDLYFIVDEEWKGKLSKLDNRFKFGLIQYDNSEQENRTSDLLNKFELLLTLSMLERVTCLWSTLLEDKTVLEIDIKADEQIRKIRPDVLLCDQRAFHLPSMYSLGIPFFFIVSYNPVAFSFEGFPRMGFDTSIDDIEGIKSVHEALEECRAKAVKLLEKNFKKRGIQRPKGVAIEFPHNPKTASIYVYPLEVDYYNEEIRAKHSLWQIDSPISDDRIPKPFEMPDEFRKLPGKIIFVSLGSLFSIYVDKLQRLVDLLDKVPNAKFIVSKGSNGEKLKFASNRFLGQNYVDQLAVLQVVDLAILHGGNNSFCEAFHFGVPQIIIPVLGDQINNGKRLEETEFGYRLDLMSYTEEQLIDSVEKALNNEELRLKVRRAGQRIRQENKSKLDSISNKVVDYIM